MKHANNDNLPKNNKALKQEYTFVTISVNASKLYKNQDITPICKIVQLISLLVTNVPLRMTEIHFSEKPEAQTF